MNNIQLVTSNVLSTARLIAQDLGKEWDIRLERILHFCLIKPESFPAKHKLSLEVSSEIDPLHLKRYLRLYIRDYYEEREGAISIKPTSTKPDPVIDEVLKAFGQVSQDKLAGISQAHRISMAAENLVGELLERYIASVLEPKGWIWCCGKTIRAVDFLKEEQGTISLLQVKNRSNSENSSSSRVRTGTSITKWWRVNAQTGRTRWEKFPDFTIGDEVARLSEEGFYTFINQSASQLHVVESSEVDE